MKKFGVILAAGKSTRFDSDTPKQFYMINKKPILFYSINSFLQCKEIDKTFVIGDVDIKSQYIEIFRRYFPNKELEFIGGGNNRQESLFNATNYINSKYGNSIIVSHCASRPYIPSNIISHHINTILPKHCVNTFKINYDTIFYNNEFTNRDKVYIGLTPQTFYSHDYISSFEKLLKQDNVDKITCACSLLKTFNIPMKAVFTNLNILKITTKEDIYLFEGLLKNVSE